MQAAQERKKIRGKWKAREPIRREKAQGGNAGGSRALRERGQALRGGWECWICGRHQRAYAAIWQKRDKTATAQKKRLTFGGKRVK